VLLLQGVSLCSYLEDLSSYAVCVVSTMHLERGQSLVILIYLIVTGGLSGRRGGRRTIP